MYVLPSAGQVNNVSIARRVNVEDVFNIRAECLDELDAVEFACRFNEVRFNGFDREYGCSECLDFLGVEFHVLEAVRYSHESIMSERFKQLRWWNESISGFGVWSGLLV